MGDSLKIEVGDYSCLIDDTECGCNPYGMDCPADCIEFELKCKYQNHNYIALKCDFNNYCDFRRQITEYDLKEYPELFIGEKE
jgi:hypothetical protein